MFSILASFCVLFSSSLLRGKGISQDRQHLFRIKPAVLLIFALLIFRGPLPSLAHLSEMVSCSPGWPQTSYVAKNTFNSWSSCFYLLELFLILFLSYCLLGLSSPHIYTPYPPTSATQRTTNKNKNKPSIWSFLSYRPHFLPGFDHAFIIYQVSIIS